jgi:hypothetical protein
MSEDRLYIRFKGKVLGPLTSQKVQELARRGQITRMHELSPDGISWNRAGDYGNLLSFDKSVSAANPNVATPQVDPKQSSPAPSRPIDSPDSSVQWYAHINGENRGPLTNAALMDAVNSGQITTETLVWRAGFDSWRPVGECFLQPLVQTNSIHVESVEKLPQSSNKMQIKNIDILSAGKIFGAIGVLIGLLLGLFLSSIAFTGFTAFGGGFADLSAVISIWAMLLGPAITGILNFIGGIIMALIYNLCAVIVGGIRVEVAGERTGSR